MKIIEKHLTCSNFIFLLLVAIPVCQNLILNILLCQKYIFIYETQLLIEADINSVKKVLRDYNNVNQFLPMGHLFTLDPNADPTGFAWDVKKFLYFKPKKMMLNFAYHDLYEHKSHKEFSVNLVLI